MALYHSVKGPVDYEVVGSPTITDGVVSGFSANDYLTLPSIQSPSSVELVMRIKTNSLTSTHHQVFLGSAGINNNGAGSIAIGRSTNPSLAPGSIGIYAYPNWANMANTFIVQENKWYDVKATFDGQTYSLYAKLATDSNYTFISNYNDNFVWNNLYLGRVYNNTNEILNGSIDLNNTYITVNGQPWFGNCPVEVKKHQIKGAVGYTKVGSPTITDGVASGFRAYPSTSSYIRVGPFTETIETCDIQVKISTGTSVIGPIIYSGGDGYSAVGIDFISNTTCRLLIKTTNGQLLVQDTNLGFTVQPNTVYYAHISFNGSIYNWKVEDYQHNVLFNYDYESTTKITKVRWALGGSVSDVSYSYWRGSIDLNETYIKVNGKLWFYQPAPTKYIVKDDKLVFADSGLYLTGTNNYTVVGTPTIVDGIASGLSDSNYLTISGTPYGASNNVEMRIKFTPTENVQGYIVGLTGGGIYLTVVNNLLRYGVSIQGGTQTTAGSAYAIQDLNIPYYLHYTFDAATLGVKVGLSSDGLNPTYGINITATQYPIITQIMFGKTYITNNNYLRGSIDLKETYIKVNGDLWFYGKNYASKNIAPVPAGYTYGTTTTNAIGWVDMRTQAFTSAPNGATIGRDE